MRNIKLLCGVLAACGGLHAQTVSRFEAASVRPNKVLSCQGQWDFSASGARLAVENVSLRRLISRAYMVSEDRVSGPEWMASECYDIQARAAGNLAEAEMMPMLQVLLQERFHLMTHREPVEMAVYALVTDKGSVKIHEYHEGDKVSVPSSIGKGRSFFMVSGPMVNLAERLSPIVGRPVVDKTGLTGVYKVAFTYAPLAAGGDIESSDVFSAVREQLGLRLESQKATIEIVKVDRADKVPVEN